MKNILLILFGLGSAVAIYMTLLDVGKAAFDKPGKKIAITMGDLTVPINATGEVLSLRLIEIKSEASGEVRAILRRAGERVRKDEVIIELDQEEEQRAVNRAKQDVERASASLEESRIRLKEAEGPGLMNAEAAVEQAKANLKLSEYRRNAIPELVSKGAIIPEEEIQRVSSHELQLAQAKSAQANLAIAKISVEQVRQTVRQAQAGYEAAQDNLLDAERRLSKTEIVAPIDGVIGDVKVQVGEVIQGGKSTITGGTVLIVMLDDSRMLVRAEVDEADIASVLDIAPAWAQPGSSNGSRMPDNFEAMEAAVDHVATINVEAFRDDTFRGVIERIYPIPKRLQSVTTYAVDVVVTSDSRTKLLPGMRAEVEFTAEFVGNVILCPNEAIREGPGGTLGVYIQSNFADGDIPGVEFIPCEFGLDNGVFSEVRKGIDKGQEVYTRLPEAPTNRRSKKSS